MAWPTTDLTTTHLDASTDDPSQARAEIKACVDAVNSIQDMRAVASGVCDLDASAKVPAARLAAAAITSALGYTPVRQGGGTSQGTDQVNLGKDTGGSYLRATVGGVDYGRLATHSWAMPVGGGTMTGALTVQGNVTATSGYGDTITIGGDASGNDIELRTSTSKAFTILSTAGPITVSIAGSIYTSGGYYCTGLLQAAAGVLSGSTITMPDISAISWGNGNAQVYSSATGHYVALSTGGTVRYVATDGAFRPNADDAYALGSADFRWDVLYAATGTISTSDAREKTPVVPLAAAELAAARALLGELGTYQRLASVERNGQDARLHVGLGAQRVGEVLSAHGLDPSRYGMWCYDAGPDRYGLRMDELLLLLVRGLDARLRALEERAPR